MPHYEFAQRYGGRRHLFSAPEKRRHRAMLIGSDERTVCRTPKSAALCKTIIPMLLFGQFPVETARWKLIQDIRSDPRREGSSCPCRTSAVGSVAILLEHAIPSLFLPLHLLLHRVGRWVFQIHRMIASDSCIQSRDACDLLQCPDTLVKSSAHCSYITHSPTQIHVLK
jgi:hypothetical protein